MREDMRNGKEKWKEGRDKLIEGRENYSKGRRKAEGEMKDQMTTQNQSPRRMKILLKLF